MGRRLRRLVPPLVAAVGVVLGASSTLAQIPGGGGGIGGIGGSGGGLGAGGGTAGASGANGVMIDAAGVLRLHHFPDPGGQLARQRIAQARVKLNPKVARASKLRKVSLNRLEAALQKRLAAGQTPTDEMALLAGLTRVRYVFYYPDSRDIVLAGPAEGWAADATGRMCGLESGRPTVQLQDLLVALRAFPPGQQAEPVILCSIDPTPEGLARMQDFLRSVGSHIGPNDTQMIVDGLRTSLGMQNVRVGGIPASTHFAQVLLECDYRMKLIGIGLERPPVRMVSYVDRASPNRSRSALERWYFVPEEHCARVSADALGLELVGDAVKLVSENQIVARDGNRKATGRVDRASESFTRTFTQKYAELAQYLPVFAEMRNLVDLAIAAAFIRQHDYYSQAGWSADTFRDEQALPVETYQTPLQVETVCTAVWKGSRLMTPVGGGVSIHAAEPLQSSRVLSDADGKVELARESIRLEDLPADSWWWD